MCIRDRYWNKYLQVDPAVKKRADQYSKNATEVKVGTYVENLKEINLKANNFSLDYLVWFNWDGKPDLDMAHNFRIYKGNITKLEVVDEYHQGNHNYQLVRVSVTVSKTFWTPRFPLESHQLRIYLESNHLINDVIFVKDDENKTNPNISIAGYKFTKSGSAAVLNEYINNHGDPRFQGNKITSEYVTQIEINRSDFGTYFKCLSLIHIYRFLFYPKAFNIALDRVGTIWFLRDNTSSWKLCSSSFSFGKASKMACALSPDE